MACMPTIKPSPSTWVLRFKAHKATVLLHVDPLHTFATMKQLLYAALQDTGLTNAETGEQIDLPESPSDIQFGRALSAHDPGEGFKLGEWEYDGEAATGTKGKGKGKARASNANDDALATSKNIKQCPKGVGLKDGAILAFRWRNDGTNWEEPPADDDELELDLEIPAGSGPGMWGVKLPSFDESYGAEEEGDTLVG